jgi:hypothetical protein
MVNGRTPVAGKKRKDKICRCTLTAGEGNEAGNDLYGLSGNKRLDENRNAVDRP